MQAWENFLTLQDAELGVETVHKWLRSLKVLRFDACNLYLEAKDHFQAMWFEEHIRPKILTKFVNNNKKKIKVHLAIANATPKAPFHKKTKSTEKSPLTPTPQFTLSFDTIDPICTFESFVQTENNKLPYKLLTKICEKPNLTKTDPNNELQTYNPIYVCGSTGTGKTHLLMATAQGLQEKGLNVLYCRAETFTEHVVSAIRAGEMSQFRQAYRNPDVLIVDDIHVFSRKGATQEEFFHTFNTLHLAGKQIILSANCTPQELQLIEARLVSRFEWGIVLPIDSFNMEECAKVLHKKAEALNYKLPPKVADFLLETFTTSTTALTKALKALILRSHLNEASAGRIISPTISVLQAKSLLGDLMQEEHQNTLTSEKIIQHVSEYFGLKSEDILGRAQSRDCVLPRQIAMFLCRVELKMPFMKIGDLFAKDHSTVMSSVKIVQRALDTDDKLDNNEIVGPLNSIRKKLR